MSKRIKNPKETQTKDLHQYLLGSVAPRPIAFVSTKDKDGNDNLAPYSFFNVFSANPPVVIFSPARRVRDNTIKHTLENVIEVPEVVINIVNYKMVQQMSLSSTEYPKGVNEFVKAGLTQLASEEVKPPRVAAAPAALECVVVDTYTVQHRGGDHRYTMTFGEVVGIHINDDFIHDGRVDTAAMQLVTRMGYDEYAVLEKAFSLSRPDNDPLLSGFVKS